MSDDEQLALVVTPHQAKVLAESARTIAAAFGAQLPPIIGTGAAIAAYAAAKAWVDTLGATFGPNVRAVADRIAGDVRSQVLVDAGLSAEGERH